MAFRFRPVFFNDFWLHFKIAKINKNLQKTIIDIFVIVN